MNARPQSGPNPIRRPAAADLPVKRRQGTRRWRVTSIGHCKRRLTNDRLLEASVRVSMSADDRVDPHDLQRFLAAQASSYEAALAELRAGRKRGHWIWYIFPQLKGLGVSPSSEFYGLSGLDEARAYLGHPVLGSRLRACVAAMLAHDGLSAEAALGATDAMKLRSSLTLFARAAPEDDALFTSALARFFGGKEDEKTLALLAAR